MDSVARRQVDRVFLEAAMIGPVAVSAIAIVDSPRKLRRRISFFQGASSTLVTIVTLGIVRVGFRERTG